MLTNGHKVAECINELKSLDVVFLSYDGPPEVYSLLRGMQNIEEVERALSVLKPADVRVWTTTVLTRRNTNFVEDIVDFCKQNNILANFTRLEFFLNLRIICIHLWMK